MNATVLDTDYIDTAPKSEKDYAVLVDKYLANIQMRQQHIDADILEIKELRAETDAIIADIMQTIKAF